MRPLPTTLAALLVLAVPATTRAEDVAAIMAALKGEAAECRYLATLCERRSRAVATMYRAGDAGHMSDAILDDATQTLNDFLRATDIMRAKHDHDPPCFKKAVAACFKDGR